MITQVQTNAVNAIADAIRNGKNLVVRSVAGSGKTFVVENFSKLQTALLKTKRTCAIAYNTNAAAELVQRCDPALYALTFHAMGKRMLSSYSTAKIDVRPVHFWYACDITGTKETNNKEERNIRLFVAGKATDLSVKAKELMSSDYAALIARFDIKTVYANIDHTDQIINIAHDIVQTTVDRFKATNLIDFVDMLYLPVAMGLRNKFDAVIIDEAQDTTPLKMALVERCLMPQSIIMVGDDNQCINIWAGATASFLANTGYPIVELSYTHRNGINGCEYVQTRFDIDHFAADNVKRDDLVAEVQSLTECAETMEEGLILSRTNADLVPVWHSLVKNGYTAQIVGNDNLPEQLIKAINNICDNVESEDNDTDIEQTAKSILETVSYNRTNALSLVSKMLGLTLCSKCGNIMVPRSGKNGYRFMGCKGFPHCRNTAKPDRNIARASFTLSTVHKQKGSTYGNVALLPNLLTEADSVEEYNIRYVASTRQTHMLLLLTQ